MRHWLQLATRNWRARPGRTVAIVLAVLVIPQQRFGSLLVLLHRMPVQLRWLSSLL